MIFLFVLASCGNQNTEQVAKLPDSINQDDSLKVKSKSTYSLYKGSDKYIRPAYYTTHQVEDVNSWPERPDTTGIYSAKIICRGKGQKSFVIYNKAGEIFQMGTLKDTKYGCDQDYKSDFIDMNFDGYLDFKINFETGATGNSWDEYWLFNPEDRKFHFNHDLSKSISAMAYMKEGRIETYYRSGMDYQVLSDLEWKGGSLILLRKETIDTSDSTSVHHIFIRINNSMAQSHADDEIFNIRD